MLFLDLIDRLFGFSEADPVRKAAIIVGFVVVIEGFFIYLSNRREKIIALKIISDVLWALQYALFGTLTASLNNLFAVGREVVFYHRGRKKWADSIGWMWFFIVLMLLSPVYEIVTEGFTPVILLPAVASALAAVAFYCTNRIVTKSLMLTCTVMYLIYNVIYSNAMGIIGTFGPITSTVAGLIHEFAEINRQKKNEGEKTE